MENMMDGMATGNLTRLSYRQQRTWLDYVLTLKTPLHARSGAEASGLRGSRGRSIRQRYG